MAETGKSNAVTAISPRLYANAPKCFITRYLATH